MGGLVRIRDKDRLRGGGILLCMYNIIAWILYVTRTCVGK